VPTPTRTAPAPTPIQTTPAPVAPTTPSPVAPAPYASVPQQAAPAAPAPPVAPAPGSMAFASCKEARAAGFSNIRSDSPYYSPNLDRDGDGVACES
jgi:hypothetical protein